ncbi:MAG: hypothetical protein DRJ42_14790 [Deltaproteobacteria bacterium]|nr:MAG: hypothetical protein DRJ42_14790 [Deltaproteobacteria bacterium]
MRAAPFIVGLVITACGGGTSTTATAPAISQTEEATQAPGPTAPDDAGQSSTNSADPTAVSAAPPEEVATTPAAGGEEPPAAAAPVALPGASASPGQAPQHAPPSAYALLTIQNFNEQLSAIARYRRLLGTIRTEVEVPANLQTAPPVCSSGVREEVAGLVREGHPSTSQIRSYRAPLDELCDSFEQWNIPDDTLSGRIQGFSSRLTRIENWMKDIRTCLDPGPYDHRCENAYGPRGGTDARDALAALAIVDEARTVLERAPGGRFPCHDPLWARIEARRWTQRVARAQMPHVPREVQRICERIGVDAATLRERVRDIRDRTNVDEANAAQRASSVQRSLDQQRRIYGLED